MVSSSAGTLRALPRGAFQRVLQGFLAVSDGRSSVRNEDVADVECCEPDEGGQVILFPPASTAVAVQGSLPDPQRTVASLDHCVTEDERAN